MKTKATKVHTPVPAKKCVHTFKCMFNSDCEALAKAELLDMTAEELSAKGDGGLRMRHNYMLINESQIIATPPDDYEPDKVGAVDLGKLQAKRNNEIRQNH